MIPYHSYDSPALVHPHHPAYTANNNPVEQELPKYTRWEFYFLKSESIYIYFINSENVR